VTPYLTGPDSQVVTPPVEVTPPEWGLRSLTGLTGPDGLLPLITAPVHWSVLSTARLFRRIKGHRLVRHLVCYNQSIGLSLRFHLRKVTMVTMTQNAYYVTRGLLCVSLWYHGNANKIWWEFFKTWQSYAPYFISLIRFSFSRRYISWTLATVCTLCFHFLFCYIAVKI